MATETVEQLKEQRILENMLIAINDLQRGGSSPIVVKALAGLYDSMMEEYNEKYPPEKEEKA